MLGYSFMKITFIIQSIYSASYSYTEALKVTETVNGFIFGEKRDQRAEPNRLNFQRIIHSLNIQNHAVSSVLVIEV